MNRDSEICVKNIKIFEQWRNDPCNRYLLSGTGNLFIFEILAMFFRAGWPEVLSVHTNELLQLLDVTKKTFYKVRTEVAEVGLVLHEPGRKKFVPVYFLGDLFKQPLQVTEVIQPLPIKEESKKPFSLFALLLIWESCGQKIDEYSEGQLGIMLRQFDPKRIVETIIELKGRNKLNIATLRRGLFYGKSWRNGKQSVTTNGSDHEEARNSYTSVGRSAPSFEGENPGDSSGSGGSDQSDG